MGRRKQRTRSPSAISKLATWDFAREVLNALEEAGVSAHRYVTMNPFRDARARDECVHLGLFIDAYLREGLPLDAEPLDLICRRLVGVLHADAYENWSFAAVTQRPQHTTSFK